MAVSLMTSLMTSWIVFLAVLVVTGAETSVLKPKDLVSNSSSCWDHYEECTLWAEIGDCQTNSDLMNSYCSLSCNTCLEEPSTIQRNIKEEEEEIKKNKWKKSLETIPHQIKKPLYVSQDKKTKKQKVEEEEEKEQQQQDKELDAAAIARGLWPEVNDFKIDAPYLTRSRRTINNGGGRRSGGQWMQRSSRSQGQGCNFLARIFGKCGGGRHGRGGGGGKGGRTGWGGGGMRGGGGKGFSLGGLFGKGGSRGGRMQHRGQRTSGGYGQMQARRPVSYGQMRSNRGGGYGQIRSNRGGGYGQMRSHRGGGCGHMRSNQGGKQGLFGGIFNKMSGW